MSVTNYNISTEIPIPLHDKEVIDETTPANVTITYSLNGNNVAKKTISISGTITTISVTY